MLCTNRSEKRLTGWFLSAAVAWLPVRMVVMWQTAHPMLVNDAPPLLIEPEQFTFTVQEGEGGARECSPSSST